MPTRPARVYGQIAGAYYGGQAIPERWRAKLSRLDTLEDFAERLLRKNGFSEA